MNTQPPQQRTAAALAARRNATEARLERVRRAADRMHTEHTPITAAALARRAGVSRTFLYQNPAAGRLLQDALARTEAAWRERAHNAEDALKAAHREITAQREQIGRLLGHIRDLEGDLPQDAAGRLMTQVTELREQLRTQSAQNKTLTERLAAARQNNRSQDHHIAQLQAELLDPAPSRHLRPV
jgi:hypothetical protein